MLSPPHRIPLAVPEHRLPLSQQHNCQDRADGQVPLQPARACCTLPPSHMCTAERTLTLRPALAAVEIQGEALVRGYPALPLLRQGWLHVHASIKK